MSETNQNPTKDFILNHLSDNKEQINNLIIESLKEKITDTVKYSLTSEIESQIKEVLDSSEIKEQIKAQISTIDLGSTLDNLLADTLSELALNMKEKVLKKFQSSWQVEQIIKAIFF